MREGEREGEVEMITVRTLDLVNIIEVMEV